MPFPGFHVFHGHPFLAQFLDNLPHIAFLPFRNGCRVEFFISFDKLLFPVFPGSRDLAFPFRGVVRVLRLVSGLEVFPVYFPDLAIQFLHRLSDLLCRRFLCHALRRFLSGVSGGFGCPGRCRLLAGGIFQSEAVHFHRQSFDLFCRRTDKRCRIPVCVQNDRLHLFRRVFYIPDIHRIVSDSRQLYSLGRGGHVSDVLSLGLHRRQPHAFLRLPDLPEDIRTSLDGHMLHLLRRFRYMTDAFRIFLYGCQLYFFCRLPDCREIPGIFQDGRQLYLFCGLLQQEDAFRSLLDGFQLYFFRRVWDEADIGRPVAYDRQLHPLTWRSDEMDVVRCVSDSCQLYLFRRSLNKADDTSVLSDRGHLDTGGRVGDHADGAGIAQYRPHVLVEQRG